MVYAFVLFVVGFLPGDAVSFRGGESKNASVTSAYGESYRKTLLQGCGEVCNTDVKGTPGKLFDEVRKHVDCTRLFNNAQSDAPADSWPPPEEIPSPLRSDYTMGGQVSVSKNFFKQRLSGNLEENVWTETAINEGIAQMLAGNFSSGSYTADSTREWFKFLEKHADHIHGKHFFVGGSRKPWLECQLLALGATHVTTIEYGKIKSEHPKISTMTPAEVRAEFLDSGGKRPHFDGGAAISSYEHSGLGRYGDALNPWGDLQAMAKAWCTLEHGSAMFVAEPTAKHDEVAWNAHRVYGPKRYPQLMANFQSVDSSEPVFNGGSQPLLLFKSEKGLP